MIETAVLFRGRHAGLYRDEVEKLLAASASEGEIGEVGRFDLETIPPGDPDFRRALSDDSFWVDDSSSVLLDNVQTWSSDDLGTLFTDLRGQGTRYTLALVHREGGAPSKKLLDVATEPVRDYRIPTDAAELTRWFTGALRDRGVELTGGTARKAIEHAGETTESLVVAIGALAAAPPEKPVDFATLRPLLGVPGAVPIFELTKAIVTGDKERSLEVLHRLLDAKIHPLAVTSVLVNRYRSYLAILSGLPTADLTKLFGISPGAANFAVKEAKKLGEPRAVRSYGLVAAAERDLKGESALDGPTTLEVLVVRLTQSFRLAAQTNGGRR